VGQPFYSPQKLNFLRKNDEKVQSCSKEKSIDSSVILTVPMTRIVSGFSYEFGLTN
jgi:hypothetical protein